MSDKELSLSILILFLSISIWSFDLNLANLYQYSSDGDSFTERDITKDLFKSLRKADKEGILLFLRTKSKDIPKSILDTAAMCEAENRDFILYGFLKITDNYYDFEVKLYDRKAGEIKTVFYAKNNISGYYDLVQTMSEKIIAYFYNTFGVIKRKSKEENEFGIINIESGLGYWIPFDPWAESLMGLVSVHISGSLTPVDPLFEWDIFAFALGYGIGLDYSLGMNKEGFESYSIHLLRMGFPVSLSGIWHSRNKIILQIAPELQLDILFQDRLYGSMVCEKSAVFSLSTSIGYEFLFPDKRFSLGFISRFHTVFYTPILFSVEPSLYYRYRFNPVRKVWSEASLPGHSRTHFSVMHSNLSGHATRWN
jgi:hypothetical protein